MDIIKEKLINDFARKIQPFYELMNWQWHGIGIPSKEDIKKTIRMLINDIESNDIENVCTKSTTGGLFAEKDKDGFVKIGWEIYSYYYSKE